MVIMSNVSGMGDAALREWLPRLWRRIEDAHYSYLETDDSPEKLQQKKKLEDYIMEYLSLAPHECKFRLTETSKVFHRTVNELPDFNAYRAGLGWAAIARYAANLLNQPWRKEYKVIRLYSGFYKHEVEANLVGAETLLMAMGYRGSGGRLVLSEPPCPDTLAAVSRDALVASCECQIMVDIWESVVGTSTARVCWQDVYRERTRYASPAAAVAALHAVSDIHDQQIYSNVPVCAVGGECYLAECGACQPALMPPYVYGAGAPCGPCYYPGAYVVPAPMLPLKLPAPLNGYPMPAYYPTVAPAVPTAQLIELDTGSERSRLSTGSSLPRSDTQPALSGPRSDGLGTYESWDYVFRNLASKERGGEAGGGAGSGERESRTLERCGRTRTRAPPPATRDLEDGLHALHIHHAIDEYNRDARKARPAARRPQPDERRTRRQPEHAGNPKADGLIVPKIAPDKVKLLSKAEIKDRKEILKLQNGTGPSAAEVKKVKKPLKLVASEVEQSSRSKPLENGTQNKSASKSTGNHQNYDIKAQLIVSLDETDSQRRSPQQNGERPVSRNSSHGKRDDGKWECGTCTYLNKLGVSACEMCGKSMRGPEIEPLRSGGRECPACTLVNPRDATLCDACATSLQHCPTYI